MPKYEIILAKKGNNTKNVTFSHLMAAFLLIIMGAVSATVIRALAETQAALRDPKIFYGVSSAYIISGVIILFITIRFNKSIIAIKRNSSILRVIEILLLLPIFIYCIVEHWYVPAAYSGIGMLGILYAFIYEKNIEKPTLISIEEEGVTLPTTKVGYLKWDAVQRLIIRHGILTLDAYGNKLYQLDLDKNQELNIEDIEAYSKKRIEEEKKLIKNDW